MTIWIQFLLMIYLINQLSIVVCYRAHKREKLISPLFFSHESKKKKKNSRCILYNCFWQLIQTVYNIGTMPVPAPSWEDLRDSIDVHIAMIKIVEAWKIIDSQVDFKIEHQLVSLIPFMYIKLLSLYFARMTYRYTVEFWKAGVTLIWSRSENAQTGTIV